MKPWIDFICGLNLGATIQRPAALTFSRLGPRVAGGFGPRRHFWLGSYLHEGELGKEYHRFT